MEESAMTGWISVGSLALYISFPSVSFFIVVITRSCQVLCRPKWPASFMRGKGGRERILENTERHSSENFSEICINCSKWSKIYLDMGHMAYILCYDTFWNTQDFWPNSTEFAQSFNIPLQPLRSCSKWSEHNSEWVFGTLVQRFT